MTRDHHFDEQHDSGGSGPRAEVAQDPHRFVVAPVVDDVFKHEGVAGGHAVEERPPDHFHPVFNAPFTQQRRSARDHVGQVEQHPTGGRRRREDRRKQAAVSAADVHDRPERREVVGRHDHRRPQVRKAGHGLIEQVSEFRGRGAVGPPVHPAQCRYARLARPYRTRQHAPVFPVQPRAVEPCRPRERRRCARAQGVRQRIEVVAAVTVLSEHATGDQRAQQPGERLRVRVDLACQVVNRERSVRQCIGQPEIGGRGDRLRHPAREDHLEHRRLGRRQPLVQPEKVVTCGLDSTGEPGRRPFGSDCHGRMLSIRGRENS